MRPSELEARLQQLKPIAQNIAICCAIYLLGDDAIKFVAESFQNRAQQIIQYRKSHRMSPFGPNREASDA